MVSPQNVPGGRYCAKTCVFQNFEQVPFFKFRHMKWCHHPDIFKRILKFLSENVKIGRAKFLVSEEMPF